MTTLQEIETLVNEDKDGKYSEMILPTELASVLINGDFSVLDYIDDGEYEEAVNNLISDLNAEGLECVDVADDKGFCKYHDMRDYGVLATNCSTFLFRKIK